MTSQEIRKQFLEFFRSKEHDIVASAPMVNKNDPTLMFTNAGMNQFKDFFLGNATPSNPRIADTQKCLRVSGKHNDLEDVGIDTYHHTMFEMLGNWSIGDYFKTESIAWGWEFLTKVCGLPEERLYVTVFEGDASEKLEFDQEAKDEWLKFVPEERILKGNKADNFWEMGEQGPCGPCSEIHYDMRPEAELADVSGASLVNMDHPQVIEIWNIVFIQFNRKADSSLEDLPAKHVDTGMGFERLVRAIQGKTSNYDCDVFTPLIKVVEDASGMKYGADEPTDIAIRVVVDHIRAVAFAIADGQLPSNTGAGYVIRRILRRAVRYAYSVLGLKEAFFHKLVAVLSKQMGETFTELPAQEEFITKVIKEEENSFLRTLETGLKRLDGIISKLDKGGAIDGKVAFELYDTFGFPLDLTALIARENEVTVDEDGFEAAMAEQKNRSRAAAEMSTGDWIEVKGGNEVAFSGYDKLEGETEILRYRVVEQKKKKLYQLVVSNTPFYAEGGGQVGDTGWLESLNEKIRIVDTKKENDLIILFAAKLPEKPEAKFMAKVDIEKRKLTENNHSATHLLHAALRSVLGEHVQQKGSYVNQDVLRFDFSHFQAMTAEEIAEVEAIVNKKIRENIAIGDHRAMPIDEAKAMGAMALFGEKYGDNVRVVAFDTDYSVELCGGTHVPATGNIGLFKIVAEASAAAGIRRVEAITADKAEAYLNEQVALVNDVKAILKNPKDVVKALEKVLEEQKELAKKIEGFEKEALNKIKDKLLTQVVAKDGVNYIAAQIAVPSADALKTLAFELKQKVDNLYAVLAADIEGKPQVAVMIDEELVKSKDLHAGKVVKELAKNIKGGGGGQPFFATAGGKDLSGLPKVIEVFVAEEAL